MLKSAGRFFITRRPFLNDLSRFFSGFLHFMGIPFHKLTFVAQWSMQPSHFPEGGFTVVKGDGYTLTQLDLEKITSLEMDVAGSSVTSENCELVLGTAENAIKLRIKATAY